ncbi:Hint domain-containing protein [Pararhodobacter oceanensis]|uniref:Hint domain-containing protein n=1 Tax=Pararhodobacter oceanensis TaxID=2172121 RepID=UPI003A8D72E7
MSDLSLNTLTLSPGGPTAAGETLTFNGAGSPGGGIDSSSDSYETTTATPDVLAVGDTVAVNGAPLSVTEITTYATTVHYDNGASTATGVPFAIVTLNDGSKVGMFMDGAASYGDTSAVVLESVSGAGPLDESDMAATSAGEAIPDGVVDGTDGNDSIESGYTDAQGDEADNSGSRIDAHGGDDTVRGGRGDDTIDGGAGNDFLFGNDGDDSIMGGEGHDSIWGDDGNDSLYGNAGDDKLIGGAGDDLLVGGEGDDTLYGDAIDGDLGGRAPGDAAEPGFGNDTLVLDGGNDLAYGGSGDDVFQVFDGFGNHTIVGGETGETGGDTLDGSAITEDVSVSYTGDEEGTMSNEGSIANFEEIERLDLGSGDDRVEIVTSTTGTVNGSDGFDTLVLPEPAPGDPAPAVTVTHSTDNGDGTTTYTGFVDFPDGSRMDFENFEEIICFTPGTMIDTLRGKRAVEDLVPGDKVLTRDNGYQPLAWVGRRDLAAAELATCPQAAPIRIAAGALGAGLPEQDLRVSPRHRMLVTGARAELMFGEREVLVTAADLLALPGVTQEAAGDVSYIHVMCERHEIIRAEGSWSESFQPSEAVLDALDTQTRAELLGLFPELAAGTGFAAARPVLNGSEARELFVA